MKKRYLVLLFILLFPIIVRADHIYNTNVDVNILKNGDAIIKEVWDVEADSGSEWYKQLYTIDEYHATVSDFYVYMDNYPLVKKDWNVDETIEQKSGYYGINYVSDGVELCFGKKDFNRHTFELTYTISNYIFNVEDAQVLYWTILPNTTQDNFSINVHSYYDFPDDMEIYGFGYTGKVYISDGKIIMNSPNGLEDNSVVLLARFPVGTFSNDNRNEKYNNFSDVLKRAKFDSVFGGIVAICAIIFSSLIIFVSVRLMILNGYGFKDNKKINRKKIPMYRDIPCDKDIYYANALLSMNTLNSTGMNILGAIILKWIRNDKIKFIKNQNDKKNSIDLRTNPNFDNQMEKELFDMLCESSVDGILENKELEKWCRKNYKKFLKLFDDNKKENIDKLKEAGHVYKRNNRHECRSKNVMDDTLYEESIKLYGLKKYLEEFSKMNTKEVMEVKLWDEYLMFAYLFGIADKVAKQLNNLYPDLNSQGFDYDSVVFVSTLSTSSINATNSSSSGGGGSAGGGGSMGGR